MKKSVRALFALLFTGAALWLSFRKIDGRSLPEAIRSVRWMWIAAALGNILLGVFILGARWRVLLRPRADIPPGPLFRLNVIAQFVNIVMPARLGEFVRLFLTARERGLPASFVLGTIGAEKVLDVLVFAGLWLTVPASLALGRPSVSLAAGAVAVVSAGAILGFVARRPEPFIRIVRAVAGFLVPSRREKIDPWIRNALEAVGFLRKPSLLGVLIFWTILLITNQVLSNYFVIRAFGLGLPVQAGLLVLLAVQAGSVPPSVPGKIGVFEYAVILALSAYAVPQGTALAYAVMLHLVAYLPKIVLGAAFMSTTEWRSALRRSNDPQAL